MKTITIKKDKVSLDKKDREILTKLENLGYNVVIVIKG